MSFFVVYDLATGQAVSTGTVEPDPAVIKDKGYGLVTLSDRPEPGAVWNFATLQYDPPAAITSEELDRALLYVKLDQIKDAVYGADRDKLVDLRTQVNDLAAVVGLGPVLVVGGS